MWRAKTQAQFQVEVEVLLNQFGKNKMSYLMFVALAGAEEAGEVRGAMIQPSCRTPWHLRLGG